jgi:hypothetical protein
VFFVPVFYVFMQRISELRRKPALEAAPVINSHHEEPELHVTLQRVERGSPVHVALDTSNA